MDRPNSVSRYWLEADLNEFARPFRCDEESTVQRKCCPTNRNWSGKPGSEKCQFLPHLKNEHIHSRTTEAATADGYHWSPHFILLRMIIGASSVGTASVIEKQFWLDRRVFTRTNDKC